MVKCTQKNCTLPFLDLAMKVHLAVARLDVSAPYTTRKHVECQQRHHEEGRLLSITKPTASFRSAWLPWLPTCPASRL